MMSATSEFSIDSVLQLARNLYVSVVVCDTTLGVFPSHIVRHTHHVLSHTHARVQQHQYSMRLTNIAASVKLACWL
jgi:hypothetical protein